MTDLPPDPLPPPHDDACETPNCMAHTLLAMGLDGAQLVLVAELMAESYVGGASLVVSLLEPQGIYVRAAGAPVMDARDQQYAFDQVMARRAVAPSPDVAAAMRNGGHGG